MVGCSVKNVCAWFTSGLSIFSLSPQKLSTTENGLLIWKPRVISRRTPYNPVYYLWNRKSYNISKKAYFLWKSPSKNFTSRVDRLLKIQFQNFYWYAELFTLTIHCELTFQYQWFFQVDIININIKDLNYQNFNGYFSIATQPVKHFILATFLSLKFWEVLQIDIW